MPLVVRQRWQRAAGADRLDVQVMVNPALRQGLSGVTITATPPEGATRDVRNMTPAADWRAAARELVWSTPAIQAADEPHRFTATFVGEHTGAAPPLRVGFTCEGCTLTGLVARPAANQPASKVHRRLVAGSYLVR